MTIRQIDVSHYRAPFKDALFLSGLGALPSLRSSALPAPPMLTGRAVQAGTQTASQSLVKQRLISALTNKETAGKTMATSATSAALTTPDTVTVTVANQVGYREFRPEALEPMFKALQNFVIRVEGNDEVISIHPMTANDPREWAPSWISRKLGEGKAIVAGIQGNIDTYPATMFTTLTETVPHLLFTVPNTDLAKSEAAPGGGTMSAVLFTPQNVATSVPSASASNAPSASVSEASSWSTTKILVVGAAVVGGVGLLAMVAKKKRG